MLRAKCADEYVMRLSQRPLRLIEQLLLGLPGAHQVFDRIQNIGIIRAEHAPVFFVLMGMQGSLASFLDPGTITLALAFTIVAIIGKIVAGLPAGRGFDRLSIGLGMTPRGEVGLIFAGIGKGIGVVDDSVFSALVVMVMLTTLVTPPALKWSLQRKP